MASGPNNSDLSPELKLMLEINKFNGAALVNKKLTLTDDARHNLRAIGKLCAHCTEKIDLMGDSWRDLDVKNIQEYIYVSELQMVCCDKISDESILYISKMPSLKTLDLGAVSSKKFTLAAFNIIVRLQHLEIVKLPFMYATDRKLVAQMRSVMPNTIVK